MRHVERDVDADPSLFVSSSLGAQIDRSAAIWIDRDRRNALRQQLAGVLESAGEAVGRVRVHVDESRRDNQAGSVDDARGAGVREPPHVDDVAAADPDVGVPPGIARAVEHAPVPNEDVITRRLAGGGNRKDQDERWNQQTAHADGHLTSL